MMEPAAVIVIAAIASAISASLGAIVAAIVTIRRMPVERKQAEAEITATWTDAQSVVIANVREENKELRTRQDTYENAIKALQTRIRELEQSERWLIRENAVLRKALEDAGIDVPEFRGEQ